MRPSRLEIEGFSAFRNHTVVDFSGADLFAFAGPTGSGKSSLIDAICVALYGSVPRLGNAAKLLPVIHVSATKATIRLDFTVAGQAYTVARVIQRRGGTASTTECRLEKGTEVLGSDVKSVEAEIVRLLGLSFGDFTKTVVLPQGAFATFLHANPKERQAVLVGLLGLGDYAEVGSLARQRKASLDERVRVLAGQVEDEAVDVATIAAAATRAGEIDALAERAARLEPEAASLVSVATAARSAEQEAQARYLQLTNIHLSPSADKLTLREAKAKENLAVGEVEEARALEEVREARKVVDAAGQPLRWEHLLDAHHDVSALLASRDGLVSDAHAAAERFSSAAKAAAAGVAAVQAVAERLNEVRQANRAAALVRDLAIGAECPVCRQTVQELPVAAEVPEFEEVKKAEVQAMTSSEAAEQDRRKAEVAHTRAVAALEAHDKATASAAAKLEGHPDAASCLERLAAATEAEAEAHRAQDRLEVCQRRSRQLRMDLEAARSALQEARNRYFEVRETLAAMGPPMPSGDLDADFVAMKEWAITQAKVEEATVAQLRAEVVAAEGEASGVTRQLADLLAAAGIQSPPPVTVGAFTVGAFTVSAELARAAERARGEHERLLEQAAAVAAKRERIAIDESAAATAGKLAGHLRVTGFEAWMLREATEILVDGANLWLDRLTRGSYSLYLDQRDLGVVDHRNADQRRGVRTLSGGETFLASLALALALAERVAELAGAGGRRLESMFLDEGFGTLDPDVLDQVAGSLEELHSDRMVGIVTHVTALSERMPVRFVVRAEPGSSTLERVGE